jgi:hypothetical protein
MVDRLASNNTKAARIYARKMSEDDFEEVLCGSKALREAKRKGHSFSTLAFDQGIDPVRFAAGARRYLVRVMVSESPESFSTFIADAWLENTSRRGSVLAFKWRDGDSEDPQDSLTIVENR